MRWQRSGVATLLGISSILAACSVSPAATQSTAPPSVTGATSSSPAVRQVHVSISDAGCAPQALDLPAGPATFIVTNLGSANVLEYEIVQADRVIGEAENVVPGIERTFTLNLKPGAYTLSCPGGTSAASGTLTVTE